jgi:4-amino-4-deoxy-L-arabinose transferase-like glycosyltransferase
VGEQSRGPLFYLPVMLADLFPWSLLIPAALWWGFRERANSAARLTLIWVVAIVTFFSFSGTKEDLYILPIVPAEAALIGAMLAAAEEEAGNLTGRRWLFAATAALFIVAGATMFWVFGISHRYALAGAAFVGGAAVVGGAASAVAALRRRIFPAATIMGGTLAVISWCVVLFSLPDFERYKPVRPFAAIIRNRASEGGIVGYYKFALPSLVYYMNRPVMEVVLPDHLRSVFRSSVDIHFVMPETDYEQIKGLLPADTYVLARQPMFDLRPRNFREGAELPQFVLISNRPAGSVPR